MSMIKLLNNKNVIRKIRLSRLLNLLLNSHSDLPSYTLLENSPKLQYPKYVSHISSSSETQDKSWDELFSTEYSKLKNCLKQLFGINVQKKEETALTHSKGLHQDAKDGNQQRRSTSQTTVSKPLPRLLYIQNPVVWLTNKLDFRYLRNWDPNFSESEFTRGARQAVSTITELLSKNMFDALKPLLTKSALLNLRKDVEILWADEVRRNIALAPGDVQLIIPRKLHFRNISDKKFCDIDMVFIGLKWLEAHGINPNPPLVFIDIIVRFHRNYSEGMKPDWTISAFKVRRFNVVPQKN